jgi:hypothetical protein
VSIRTKGELLFAGYLRNAQLQYRFEPQLPGSNQRPDFAVPCGSSEVLLDVKDFRGKPEHFGVGFSFYDGYGPIREKINIGCRKFKQLKSYTCALVLFNHDRPLVDLDPMFVYGAMFGNLGFSFPVDHRTGQGDNSKTTTVFGTGGRMHRYHGTKPVKPVNRTISAIVALRRIQLGQRRILASLAKEEVELGRKFTFEETWMRTRELSHGEMHLDLKPIRVCVCENPYATFQFPSELFRGPYDERYGADDGHLRRIFVGDGLTTLEQLERKVES